MVFKDNAAEDLEYLVDTCDSIYDQHVDLPTTNRALYLKSRKLAIGGKVKNDKAVWTGIRESIKPPDWFARCYFSADVNISRDLARLMSHPGILRYRIEFCITTHDYTTDPPEVDSWQLDVSKALKYAVVSYLANTFRGQTLVLAAVVAGTFIYEGVAPQILMWAKLKHVLATNLYSGISVRFNGTYSAAYFDATLDYELAEDAVRASVSQDSDFGVISLGSDDESRSEEGDP